MRRIVEIKNFEELEEELDDLEYANRKETTGRWTFYQILSHINDSIHSSMYGYMALMPWLLRKTIGRLVLARIIAEGKMNPGHYNPTAPRDREDGDEASALVRLRESIKEFKNWEGKFAIHPIFDVMDKKTWERLHCIHASLHLSFVHPIKTSNLDLDSQKDYMAKEEKPEELKKVSKKTVLGKNKSKKKKVSKKAASMKKKS